jgi:hypothetical protein
MKLVIFVSPPPLYVPVEKYSKIKYAIFDRRHNLEIDLFDTSFNLLNG